MVGQLPLPTLLSHALVAFTIEFDNEAEHCLPHRTTIHGSASPSSPGLGAPSTFHSPWLVSMVMWWNCMRFLQGDPVPVRELERLARTPTNLHGMQRWGYIVVAPEPSDTRPKSPRSSWLVHATPSGRLAQMIWRPLFDVIEERWRERFGGIEIDGLKQNLAAMAGQLSANLPDCLPILGYGLFCKGRIAARSVPGVTAENTASNSPLPALLSKVLLAFALEFESESSLSLAICANLVRILDESGVRFRDLPILSGVSKEAASMAMGILRKTRLTVIEPDPAGSPWKIARLTAKGLTVKQSYLDQLAAIEERWQDRFGQDLIRDLRGLLKPLVGDATAEQSPLFSGLEPYPDGWRSFVRRPHTLPHFPTVLHRGGYPDGS